MLWEHGNQILLTGRDKFEEEALPPPMKRFKFLAHKMSQNMDSETGSSPSSDGSQVSKCMHVGGGRSSARNFWCFWYDELLEQFSEHLWQTVLIAQDILAVPASQAYVERGFSVYSLLTAGRRNRMTESLQMWACLKLNKKILANTGINVFVWTLELQL